MVVWERSLGRPERGLLGVSDGVGVGVGNTKVCTSSLLCYQE